MRIFVVKHHFPYEGFENSGFFQTEEKALAHVNKYNEDFSYKRVSCAEVVDEFGNNIDSEHVFVDSWGNRITIDCVEVL